MLEKETQEITLVHFFSLLVKWRRRIIRNFIILAAVSLIIALLLPKWYTSSATLLPPETESSSSMGLFSLMADLPVNLKSIIGGTGTSPSELYLGILRSRNLREAVIKKLDLMSLWEVQLMEDALRTLDGLTDVDQTEEGLIVISATARTGELAQKMTQAYVEELDRVNRNLRFSTARQTREFIEKRLKETETDLHRTAENLRDFQKKYGVISLEEQTRASLKAAAEIRAQVAVKEVEYEMLRQQFDESHERIKLLKANISALEQQLQRVESGDNSSNDVLLAFSNLPDLGMQYVFLLKDAEVQKAIYKLLAQQYEEARIRETRDTPTVQLLDAPALPERKSKPKRLYFVLAGVILSFFISGFEIAVSGYLNRLKTTAPEEHHRLMDAYETLRADAKRLVRWKRNRRGA